MATPRLCEAERLAHDALDLDGRVLARVERGAVLADATRAEVEPADELADDEHVDPVGNRGPQVRIRVERRTQGKEPLLRANVCAVELRVADRRLQHRYRGKARVARLVRERGSRCADRCAPDRALHDLDVWHEQLEHEPRLVRDLWPDSVPRQEDDRPALATRQTRSPGTTSAGGRAGAA